MTKPFCFNESKYSMQSGRFVIYALFNDELIIAGTKDAMPRQINNDETSPPPPHLWICVSMLNAKERKIWPKGWYREISPPWPSAVSERDNDCAVWRLAGN